MSIRVFHIISHFDMGGAERVAANIAMSENKDVEYHVVEIMRGSSAFTQEFIGELMAKGVICHRSWIPDIHFHYLVERLAALIFPLRFLLIWLRWKPNVVHTHTETPDLSTFVAFKTLPFLKKKCLIVRTIHNTRLWSGQIKMGKRVELFMMANSCNIAISKAVANAYRNMYGEPTGIVYNGMAKVEQLPYPALRQGKVNILFAARFEPQKGIETLVRIVKRMANDGRYFFHIHGNGSMKDYIGSELGRQANVELGDSIFGVAKYMSSFDYLLMPSEHEGLALTPIEASLAGLPTIINHAEGLYETLPEGWKLTVYNNNVDEYIHLFEDVIPQISRSQLTEEAQHFALENFTIEKMRHEYEKIYFQYF